MQLKDNWSHSVATFNGGTSYTVGGVRFVKGAPKPVTSLAVRKALEGVDGFLIQDFHKEEPKPAPAPVKEEEPNEELEGESDSDEAPVEAPAPKRKIVKKTVKKTAKKKVKRVKGGKDA